ncbi:MAG: 4,5-DOPA dioxygenase extradiol [Coriobacteriia bacterium]|nr:4,5-DOPA dioxygenase extradiol [Coriobacteriia bacterium]
MPALFLAHGNPMNALEDNAFTRSLSTLAADLPRPKAVLVVSAHWLTRGTHVLASATPRTIHDFGGFPRELYEVEYPAAGSPEGAELVCELLPEARPDESWGLDHASWTVLRHMWPGADVPVFELSLDADAPPAHHFDLGRKLAPLRDAGVLVIGSGNIVHSFAGVSWEPNATPKPWAEEFDAWIADALVRGDDRALVDYESAGTMARLSVPTNDHYLPLLYTAAMRDEHDAVTFPHAGVNMGSMSMRCVRLG